MWYLCLLLPRHKAATLSADATTFAFHFRKRSHLLSTSICILSQKTLSSLWLQRPKRQALCHSAPPCGIPSAPTGPLNCCHLISLYNAKVTVKPISATIQNCILTDAPNCQSRNHVSMTVILSKRMLMAAPRCEKPISTNRWCRWLLSGLNGE